MDPMAHSNNIAQGKIPVPSQMPRRFNRNQLPDKVLRSGAIESLISHNEDLMSRLQVTLRRISLLEEKLHQSNKSQSKFKFHYKNLKDQVLILKEKEKYLRERKNMAEGKFNTLRQRIRILEVEYARLYTSFQDKKTVFATTLTKLSRRIKRLNKSKSRILFVAHKLRKSFRKTQNDLGTLTKDSTTLKIKLGESTTYIQEQAKKFREEKYTYEKKSQQQINELNNELTALRKKNLKFR